MARLADAVNAAARVVILLTHAHDDHTAGAADLARTLGAEVSGPGGQRAIEDGGTFSTSDGELVAVSTPGHARRHFCFHLPRTGEAFAGDLILGEGDTTWVGEYPGAVAQYLASLDRLEALRPRVIHPAHGPDILDPAAAIERFRRHRLSRIEMVRSALDAGHTDSAAITRHVYGALPREVRAMALASVEAILDYLSGAE
ncbi:MAG: MBL fold metallo-hydrolase [Gemmatimonadetes bacterium]|nr:MBL fold metallo-hydrolase [Gemmatimonadota bacterium]MYG35200.1 MBL fold metallo-hydrolase [Gemmatimonadota bacterium]MYJ18300.1 MBL fold metallo-hydrolase [Gemmatimonadota bacterium]